MMDDFLGSELTAKLEDWQDQTKDSFCEVIQTMEALEDDFFEKEEELLEKVEDWAESSPYSKYC